MSVLKISSIVIVGGGTSGWLTAAYLSNACPEVSITVIDKEIGTPIGVGEATLLNFKPFMEECGFEVDDWFSKIDAGYKSGILFTNWCKSNHEIWHPFYKGNRTVSIGNTKNKPVYMHDVWSKAQHLDFKKYSLGYYEASIDHNVVDSSSLHNYAFHVDCGKLVTYIQEKIKDKINIIRSDVVNVVVNDSGGVKHLELKNGSTITTDLFVDCTGFKNLLRAPKKRVDLTDRLFVNTAVVCQVPYKDRPEEFKPYAVCDAVDHGWIWKIGVSSRIGSGLVFNRDLTSIDEAKQCFADYWKGRVDIDKIRVIDWTPFYNKDQWEDNVVSIGLSAGFIEPLESTGIGLITAGITQLNNVVREQYYDQDNVDFFNLQMKLYFEDCVDFVSGHYANNNRTSKFWNFVKDKFEPSEKMKYFIEHLADPTINIPYNGKFNLIFAGVNWSLMLLQLGYPVAPRDIDITDEQAEELLIKNYLKYEKHKHVWSRPHSLEVDRLSEISKL